MSSVFRPSIREIGLREGSPSTRETGSFILFSAKTQTYQKSTRTYTQSGVENSPFQFCLTITELLSPFYLEEMKNYYSLSVSRAVSRLIMRVRKPKVEYKLVRLYS